jgi:hypothetical protein
LVRTRRSSRPNNESIKNRVGDQARDIASGLDRIQRVSNRNACKQLPGNYFRDRLEELFRLPIPSDQVRAIAHGLAIPHGSFGKRNLPQLERECPSDKDANHYDFDHRCLPAGETAQETRLARTGETDVAVLRKRGVAPKGDANEPNLSGGTEGVYALHPCPGAVRRIGTCASMNAGLATPMATRPALVGRDPRRDSGQSSRILRNHR